jgi:hypothetical protein
MTPGVRRLESAQARLLPPPRPLARAPLLGQEGSELTLGQEGSRITTHESRSNDLRRLLMIDDP